MSARWDENNTRQICMRYVVTGKLRLVTAAHFGNGQVDDLVDMPLMRDPKNNLPLLTGASIAGALRSYLRDYEHGYGEPEPANKASTPRLLFGAVLEDEKESRESYLVVDDSIAESDGTETRPGVALDPKTHTARPKQLYDFELLEAGTMFPLRFELSLPADEEIPDKLRAGLAAALSGLQSGEIGLGSRKRRGFGECSVDAWKVECYDLRTGPGLLAWIEAKEGRLMSGDSIASQLEVKNKVTDQRKRFILNAAFSLESSLLIRSGSGSADSPDMVHLKSRRGADPVPILSGTSLAGALRSRALRIANTVHPNGAKDLVESLFGPEDVTSDEPPWASRILVREREITAGYERVQSRVKIDRFTGGSFPGALFEQQPVFGGLQTRVKVEVELRSPKAEEIGLLLHLLRDLWTADLPLGGEASVGRGRLRGVCAKMILQEPSKSPQVWEFDAKDDQSVSPKVGELQELNAYASSAGGAA